MYCLEKGIDYTLHYLPEGPNPQWLLDVSPEGKLPVMKDEDKLIADSTKIIEHLEATFGQKEPSLNPPEAKEWVDYLHREFFPIFAKNMMGTAPPVQKEFRPKLIEALKKLNQAIGKNGGPYFLGKEYSMVDIVYTPIVARFPLLQHFR